MPQLSLKGCTPGWGFGTCIVPGDAGEVLIQELLQGLALGGGGQALDELQVNRRGVVLHVLGTQCTG